MNTFQLPTLCSHCLLWLWLQGKLVSWGFPSRSAWKGTVSGSVLLCAFAFHIVPVLSRLLTLMPEFEIFHFIFACGSSLKRINIVLQIMCLVSHQLLFSGSTKFTICFSLSYTQPGGVVPKAIDRHWHMSALDSN